MEIKQLVYRLAEKAKEREKAEDTASPPKRKHSDEENYGAVRSNEKFTTTGTEDLSQKAMVDEPDDSSSKRQSKRKKVAIVQEPMGIPFPSSFSFFFFLFIFFFCFSLQTPK